MSRATGRRDRRFPTSSTAAPTVSSSRCGSAGKGMYPALLEVLGDEPSEQGYYADQVSGALNERARRWRTLFTAHTRDDWIERLRAVGVACEPVLRSGRGAVRSPPGRDRPRRGAHRRRPARRRGRLAHLGAVPHRRSERRRNRHRPAGGRPTRPLGGPPGRRLLGLRRGAPRCAGARRSGRRRDQGRTARWRGDAGRGLRRGGVPARQAQRGPRHRRAGGPAGRRGPAGVGRRGAAQLPGRRVRPAGHRRGHRRAVPARRGLLPRQRIRTDRTAGEVTRQRRAHAGADRVRAGGRWRRQRPDRRHLDPHRHVGRVGRRDRHARRPLRPRRPPARASGWRPACSAPGCCSRAGCSSATAPSSQDRRSTVPRRATGPATASTSVATATGSRWSSPTRRRGPRCDRWSGSTPCPRPTFRCDPEPKRAAAGDHAGAVEAEAVLEKAFATRARSDVDRSPARHRCARRARRGDGPRRLPPGDPR